MDMARTAEELAKEAGDGAFLHDRFQLHFNDAGFARYRDRLPAGETRPVYAVDVAGIRYDGFVRNLDSLLPLVKGFSLRLVAPQKRRRLVTFLNERVLAFIDRPELESVAQVISELTANAEKSNLESLLARRKPAAGQGGAAELRERRDEILAEAAAAGLWTEVSWKFSPRIFKVEVRNNCVIPEYALDSIRRKMAESLDNLAEGYVGEVFDKLGAGLGLYFVHFLGAELKDKYGFETIFRVFSTETVTSASLTVFFDQAR